MWLRWLSSVALLQKMTQRPRLLSFCNYATSNRCPPGSGGSWREMKEAHQLLMSWSIRSPVLSAILHWTALFPQSQVTGRGTRKCKGAYESLVSTKNFSHNKGRKIHKNKTWGAICFALALTLLHISPMILIMWFICFKSVSSCIKWVQWVRPSS